MKWLDFVFPTSSPLASVRPDLRFSSGCLSFKYRLQVMYNNIMARATYAKGEEIDRTRTGCNARLIVH
jgi:hypothetical protein